MLSSHITSVPGSSTYFLGGAVTYSNESKENILNVPSLVITENGAVSEETACGMAEGVRKLVGSDISVSITGIAGPDGGTAEKPVGLVWIGISAEKKTYAKRFVFDGDRENIRKSAVSAAMRLLKEAAEDLF
jgi:PncC family amidohydrolase